MKRILNDFAYGDGPVASCFWRDTTTDVTCAPLDGVRHADVAIIGAGYTGLSAALRLAEAGLDVVVVEANQPGWGASGRNAGFCCMGGAKASDAAITRRVGGDGLMDYRRTERDSVQFVSDLTTRLEMDIDRVPDGEVMLAHRAADFDGFGAEADALAEVIGERPRLIPRAELAQEGFGGDFHGGLLMHAGFGLNPRKYVMGLARGALDAGVTIYGETAVTSMTRSGAGHVLTTTNGTLHAGKVLVATNGYTSEDVPKWMRARVLPVQTSIIVTRKLTDDDLMRQGWTSNIPAYDTRKLLHYFRLLPDGRFLFGMRAGVRSTAASHQSSQARIRADFDAMFPGWSEVETPWFWSGFLGMSSALTPFSGPVPGVPGLFAAFAYHGNGVAMGSYAGALAADAMLGRSDDLRWPEVMRNPPRRFPGGRLRRLGLYPAYWAYGRKDA